MGELVDDADLKAHIRQATMRSDRRGLAFQHESGELAAVAPRLSPDALVLSDNAHESDAFLVWAERSGRRFTFFREEPSGHWWPGDGIGAAIGAK